MKIESNTESIDGLWVVSIVLPDSDKSEEFVSRLSPMDAWQKASAAVVDFMFGMTGEQCPVCEDVSYFERGVVWRLSND